MRNPKRSSWISVLLSICLGVVSSTHCAGAAEEGGTWPQYLGDSHKTHYSSLDQINESNVANLQVAWTFSSGVKGHVQCNPIIVDGRLYGSLSDMSVFALDAATGEQIWRHTPNPKGMASPIRGLMVWESGEDLRILYGSGSSLKALDARTGEPIIDFGEAGSVDLKQGFHRDASKLYVSSTTPGVIYKGLVIVCQRVNEAHPAAPGDVRAFDVRTGELKWTFHTIPHPGEFGFDTWPPGAWRTSGGANCWGGMSLDEERGIVYVPTGSAAYDFYGADRPGQNLFANCLIALDAATGKRIWHYQMVHHDLWDRDLPAPPNLVTLTIDGRRRDAVAQITKLAHVFVFDRVTGEPLFPINEVPVEASTVPGEVSWPTQPIPVKPPPFARQEFTPDLVTDLSPESRAHVSARLRRVKSGKPFTPIGLEGTVIFPGYDGGGEWGGAAVDPRSGVMYVNSSEMPYITALYELSDDGGEGANATGRRIYALNCIYCHGPNLAGDPLQEFPPLSGIGAKYSIGQICDLLKTGRNRMPSFEHLSDTEAQAVARYLLEMEKQGPSGLESRATGEGPAQPGAGAADGKRNFVHTGYDRFLDLEGYPAVKPPWGTLNAIDLNKGEILWKVPLGDCPELAERGFKNTGTENYGGPAVTAGGLVFIAATKDAKIRAFSQRDGRLLWEADLPAAGFATPSIYEAGGRQFVVIAAFGGKLGTPAGDSYVAFALPEKNGKDRGDRED